MYQSSSAHSSANATIAIPAAAQLVQFDPTRLPGHVSMLKSGWSKSGSLACFKVTRKKVDWEDLPKDVITRKYHIVWTHHVDFNCCKPIKTKLTRMHWGQNLYHYAVTWIQYDGLYGILSAVWWLLELSSVKPWRFDRFPQDPANKKRTAEGAD